MQTLLLLDPYHFDDALFLRLLARRLAGPGAALRPLFVAHGSGERAERLLESAGYDAVRRDGVLQSTPGEQQRLVERGIRESNQRIVASLTDEGVAAVSIQGCDRRLFRPESGGLTAVLGDDLLRIAAAGAVPVISMLRAETPAAAVEVSPHEAVPALARALNTHGPCRVVFLSVDGYPGLRVDGRFVHRIDGLDDAAALALDPAAGGTARSLTGLELEVWISSASGLAEPVAGTQIISGGGETAA